MYSLFKNAYSLNIYREQYGKNIVNMYREQYRPSRLINYDKVMFELKKCSDICTNCNFQKLQKLKKTGHMEIDGGHLTKNIFYRKIANIDVLIKTIFISKEDKENYMSKERYNNIIKYTKFFSDKVLNGETQNFLLFYSLKKCPKCFIREDNKSSCIILYIEKADMNIYELKIKDKEWVKLIINILEILKYIQSFNIIHGDFHPGNILIKKIDNINVPIINDLDKCRTIEKWNLEYSKEDIYKFFDFICKYNLCQTIFEKTFIEYLDSIKIFIKNYNKDLNIVNEVIYKLENYF